MTTYDGPLSTQDEIDDAVDAWHRSGPETGELHEYLGWTWEQYSAWAERCVIPTDTAPTKPDSDRQARHNGDPDVQPTNPRVTMGLCPDATAPASDRSQ